MRKKILLSTALIFILTACSYHTPPAQTNTSNPAKAIFTPATWNDLPNWQEADLRPSWAAFIIGCSKASVLLQAACTQANALQRQMPNNLQIRQFFENQFEVKSIQNADNSTQGLITGYYEPELVGSLTASSSYPYAIYAVPDDLIQVDLSSVYPQLKNMRLRGKIVGNQLKPYPSRAELAKNPNASLQNKAIAWVQDPVALAFLHIQGSGRIHLADGSVLRVGYADQNGHPYKAIGKWLIDQDELSREQVSMQTIMAWAKAHPERVEDLLNSNPSYVFFRQLNELNAEAGPIGALGVPLSAGYSVAIDTKLLPLGLPIYLNSQLPNQQPLQRLVMAQDMGGAVNGAVRADFFFGTGEAAGEQAGKMKQTGQLWVLLPKNKP